MDFLVLLLALALGGAILASALYTIVVVAAVAWWILVRVARLFGAPRR